MSNDGSFAFKKHDKVGVADAADDKEVLLETFVDTGDYKCIEDFSRPERFILGRAGAGKTALITMLTEKHDNVIVIEPDSLSLGYISNSTIIKTLSDLGVDFDLFFKLLWRHVLGVEVLKHHFKIGDQKFQISVIDKLKDKFSKSTKRTNHIKALEYLEKWGSSFWQDTDYRVKELTSSMESDIKARLGGKKGPLVAELGAQKSIKATEKAEIVYKSQDVVNSVQMKELADLIKMLDEAIDDRQKQYYLIIDKLDDNWVDDSFRYKLIKALLETVKDFNVVKQVKPMIVLRQDLIGRVYDQTRRSGFQEEKFTTLELPVRWTKKQLLNMLNRRIDHLIKKRYVGSSVTFKDVLPPNIGGELIDEYLINRTLMRPRDLISFFNLCIEEATDSPLINEDMVIRAEREYSRDRRSSVRDEWYEDYPALNKWDSLLQNMNKEFFLEDLPESVIENLVLNYENSSGIIADKMHVLVQKVLGEEMDYSTLRKHLFQIFYAVGYIGAQLANSGKYIWSFESRKMLHLEEINEDAVFKIHPCFWSAFTAK